MTWHEKLDDLMESLERERDELRVQVNLASKEAREEFAAMEHRLGTLRERLKDASTDARDTAGDVGDVMGETARKLTEEMREGYRKLRETLAD